jgi:hypothetical protein
MRSARIRPALARLCIAFALVLAGAAPAALAVDTQEAVTVGVENISAKVGERTTLVAKIVPKSGYVIAEAYRNRVLKLSAAEGVDIHGEVVQGVVKDGSLVFRIPLTVTKPGPHAINGVMRFAFVNALDDQRHLDIKWEPLMATVTGIE